MSNEEQPRCKDAWESKAMELAFALAENYGVTAEATAVHGDALLRHLQTRYIALASPPPAAQPAPAGDAAALVDYIRETLIEAQTYCSSASWSPSMCNQIAHAVTKLDRLTAISARQADTGGTG